jgi:hypothetical protein
MRVMQFDRVQRSVQRAAKRYLNRVEEPGTGWKLRVVFLIPADTQEAAGSDTTKTPDDNLIHIITWNANKK